MVTRIVGGSVVRSDRRRTSLGLTAVVVSVIALLASSAVASAATAGVGTVATAAGPPAAVAAAAQPPGGIVESAPGFGWTKGSFSVGDDGAARYSLPLWEPAGRGGDKVAPKLSLSYNSRAGNGPLGVGWSLGGLSSISWCPRGFFAADVDGDGADDMLNVVADPDDDELDEVVVRSGSRAGQKFGAPHVALSVPDSTLGSVRVVDVDLDGKAELLVSFEQGTKHSWRLLEPDGFDYRLAPGGALDDWNDNAGGAFRLADLDGNGFADFVAEHRTSADSADYWIYRLNTGRARSWAFRA